MEMIINCAISLGKLFINILEYFFTLSTNIIQCLTLRSQELYYKIKDTITAPNVFKEYVLYSLNTLNKSLKNYLAEMNNNNSPSFFGKILKMVIKLGETTCNAIGGVGYATYSIICFVIDSIYNMLESVWLGWPIKLGDVKPLEGTVIKITFQGIVTFMMVLVSISIYMACFRQINSFIGILITAPIRICLDACKSLFMGLYRRIFSQSLQKSRVTRFDDNEIETLIASTICVVCYERVRRILLFPCCHLCICEECTTSLFLQWPNKKVPCPICRTPIHCHLLVYT